MVDSGPVPPINPSVLATDLLLGSGARRFTDLVLRFRYAHDPLIKPADDVLQTLDPVPRLTRTREFVRLIRKTNHHRRYPPILQRAKHRFAAGTSGCAPISLTENQHQRCLDLVDVSYRRTPAIVF